MQELMRTNYFKVKEKFLQNAKVIKMTLSVTTISMII